MVQSYIEQPHAISELKFKSALTFRSSLYNRLNSLKKLGSGKKLRLRAHFARDVGDPLRLHRFICVVTREANCSKRKPVERHGFDQAVTHSLEGTCRLKSEGPPALCWSCGSFSKASPHSGMPLWRTLTCISSRQHHAHHPERP
jgi:hypothetical protein